MSLTPKLGKRGRISKVSIREYLMEDLICREAAYLNTMIKTENKLPLFSIIMPNYNNGKYIAEAIESVLCQTYANWELVIVDDASTDNSVSIIAPYLKNKKIKLIINETNKGVSFSARRAVKNSSGEIIGTLDSDDVLRKDALMVMAEAHLAHPESGLIYSNHYKCDENLNIIRKEELLNPLPIDDSLQEVLSSDKYDKIVSFHFRTYKREAYEQTDGYDINFKSYEDRDLYYKLEKVTKVACVERYLYYYRHSGTHGAYRNNPMALYYKFFCEHKELKRRLGINPPLVDRDAMHPLFVNIVYIYLKKYLSDLKKTEFRSFFVQMGHSKLNLSKLLSFIYFLNSMIYGVTPISFRSIKKFISPKDFKKKKRILYVCDKLITFVLNEIIELKNAGHDVFILSYHKDRRIYKNITQPILVKNSLLDKTFCRFTSYKNRREKLIHLLTKVLKDFINHPIIVLKTFFFMLRIFPNIGIGTENYLDIRHLFSLKFDIIHAPFSTPSTIDKVYFIAKSLNVPFTLSFRAHDIFEGNNLSELRKKGNIINESAQIMTIASYNKSILMKNFNTNMDIKIVHSAIDLGLFKSKGESRSNKSILSVCRFHEQKGIEYLIEACHILNKRKIEYDCTLIGEGPEKKKYEAQIAQFDIPNIHFIDYVSHDKIKKFLESTTVFVLPCVIAKNGLRDVLANSLKEAMAMQVPIITSHICGIEELVETGISGILVPPNDSSAIADAIETLFSDSELREKMGRAGMKKIWSDFNIKREANKLEEVFMDVISNA